MSSSSATRNTNGGLSGSIMALVLADRARLISSHRARICSRVGSVGRFVGSSKLANWQTCCRFQFTAPPHRAHFKSPTSVAFVLIDRLLGAIPLLPVLTPRLEVQEPHVAVETQQPPDFLFPFGPGQLSKFLGWFIELYEISVSMAYSALCGATAVLGFKQSIGFVRCQSKIRFQYQPRLCAVPFLESVSKKRSALCGASLQIGCTAQLGFVRCQIAARLHRMNRLSKPPPSPFQDSTGTTDSSSTASPPTASRANGSAPWWHSRAVP